MASEDSTNSGGYVLMSTEVELYVQALQTFPLDEIASKKWSNQREMLEKLNMQAVLSASSNETEYVKDSLVTYEKTPVLVHELICMELWNEKIFSQLFSLDDFKPKTSLIIYMIIYHEATIVNLLETVLFHSEVCQSLDDTVFDLVDYIYRKMTDQIRHFQTQQQDPTQSKESDEDVMNELREQNKKIQFDIFIKLFSILRYIIDNLANLPLGVTNRILNAHDFILLLQQAVELSMWTKRDKEGKFYKYMDNKWKLVPLNERFQLTKLEGQIWISLYELLLNPICASKYEYTDYKKNQILKLRSHINEVIIDQIPNLAALQRFLENLAISEPPAAKSELVIEQVPEIYDNIVRKYKGKWKEVAKSQAKSVLDPDLSEVKENAKRWAETFNSQALESLIDEPAKCAECGEPAPKRCSRCQSEWYCRRECQVKHWSKHKKACDMIFAALNSAK